MPLSREWADDLIQYWHSNLAKGNCRTTTIAQDLTGNRKERVHTLEGCLFVACVGWEWLGYDSSEHFDVEVPSGIAIRWVERKLGFEERCVQLDAVKADACEE